MMIMISPICFDTTQSGEVYNGRINGNISVNGQPISSKDMKSMSGFVFQDDVILDTMTVK
jgi:ABC-type multidrug transport system ATPase subunit